MTAPSYSSLGGFAAAADPTIAVLAPASCAAGTNLLDSDASAIQALYNAVVNGHGDAGHDELTSTPGIDPLFEDPSLLNTLGGTLSSPLTHGDQPLLDLAPPPGTTPGAQNALLSNFACSAPGPFETVAAAQLADSIPVATADLLSGFGTVAIHTAVSMQAHDHHSGRSTNDEQAPVVTAVKIISDQLASVNSSTPLHDFGLCDWTLAFETVKNDNSGSASAVAGGSNSNAAEHQVNVTVPVKVTTTTAGLVDLKWEAVLIPMTANQLKKRIELDQLVAGPNWSALRATGSADGGENTQIGVRTVPLEMTFSVTKRKKCLLVIVVNGVVAKGVPKMVHLICDRHARRKKRKANVQDDQGTDDCDLPESSPTPVAKRTKLAGAVPVAMTGHAASRIEHEHDPPTPPPSPQFGPHIRHEVALLDMIERDAVFDPTLFDLLKAFQFQAEVIQKAALLLFEFHIRGSANSTWTPAQIVETFALLGIHADLIRQHSWTSSVTYPDPLHALAQCTRPDLVDTLFEYLYPRQVPTPARVPCLESSHVGHSHMVCNPCRAFATYSALSRVNGKGYLPIHTAAWKKNTVFVAHHLRIKGAKATFTTASRCDRNGGGNFLHATCGSKSAVDWLEKLWTEVIIDEADRKVVANALLLEDDRGRTPLDMAKFQAEKRDETPTQSKQRTLAWVQEKLALYA